MIIRILINLLFIYAAWQVIKFVFRVALAYWIRKNAGKAFQFQGRSGWGAEEPRRPEGDIRVESAGNPGRKRPSDSGEGEYIDFEEIR